jgi:hypothetical protein
MEGHEEMTAIEHLYVLHNNPFLLARTLLEFFEALGDNKEHSLLLAYLVLPIVLDKENRDELTRAISTSNLRTFVGRGERLRAMPDRVAHYRASCNACLRYLVTVNAIEFVGSSVRVTNSDALSNHVSPKGVNDAARVLARFFQNHQVPTIYRMMGVMGL